ncbi:MAG: preprotein translocase subunit SecA [Flavobacteriales bacterium]|nr:preprotein translocase subunit SecA [Flavobacteriales bacterium]MCX7768422.1 preprotein translocase subunit SecA [Flavobacteriales bacterium]MDW8409685.1 preprotein translocase subunit SecA [Flavobacteriales bacterium]
MLKSLLKLLSSRQQEDRLKAYEPFLKAVNQAYERLQSLSHDELRGKTQEFRALIESRTAEERKRIEELKAEAARNAYENPEANEKIFEEIDKLQKIIYDKTEVVLNEILPEAFAVVKETARRFTVNTELRVKATELDRNIAARGVDFLHIEGDTAVWKNSWMAAGNKITWDMVHYDVQLIGGRVLHEGKIAEMATGEGKTLVATLPVYLNALPGQGVHVVTVNDYLARRDAQWNGPIFMFLGLTVDCIDLYEPHSPQRRQAYLADITYGTNNEFGFDYLRDNMVRSPEEMVQRGHNYAIVDEVDSVLIDDARTPLIISGPTPKGDKHEFDQLKPRVEKLVNFQKKLVTAELAEAKKLLSGEYSKEDEKKAGEKLLRAFRGLPKNSALIKFLSEPGMKTLLQKTENYYLQDQQKEMHKIDDELYFVIDEKNHTVELTEKGINLITEEGEDKNFFIIPDINMELAALEKSNLPKEEKLKRKEALIMEFSTKSERIHSINQLLKAYTLYEKDVDYVIMDGKVKIVDEQTGRILEGRRYSDGLHQAIEAKENVKVEAATQTYATITLQNYFRMYRKLAGMTGTAETEAKEFYDIYKLEVEVIPTNKPVIRIDEDDRVYKTKREKYNAVIEKIEEYLKAGRPVLVGTTSVETSELLSRMLTMRKIKHQVLNAKYHQKEAEIVAKAGQAGTVTIATNMAGRGTDIKLGPGVREAGGLAIIGTERHESRRVDRQLRGRAGRQGDPGSSLFFVSLEDDLMRLFGSERLARLMDRLGYKEGEVLTHPMITKSIERAQKKVEENHFGIRKRLLEYDDVMNKQREVIYRRRRNALFGDRISNDILTLMHDYAGHVVQSALDNRSYEDFEMELLKTLTLEPPVGEKEFFSESPEVITEKVFKAIHEAYRRRAEALRHMAMPVIRQVYEQQGHQFQNIIVPITDGTKVLHVAANLKKCVETDGKELTVSVEKGITLALLDEAWKDHLREMDELRQSVQNAYLEQKDPLLVYKLESSNVFWQMLQNLNTGILSFLLKCRINVEQPEQVREAREQRTDSRLLRTSRPGLEPPTSLPGQPVHAGRERPRQMPVRAEVRIGRNDPCPCGSGKKFKNCHGAAVGTIV